MPCEGLVQQARDEHISQTIQDRYNIISLVPRSLWVRPEAKETNKRHIRTNNALKGWDLSILKDRDL